MTWAYLDHPSPFVIAHRGFDRDGRENSMAAFGAAVELGVGYLETDVHATRDGRLVAFHDSTLDRVTTGSGALHSLDWDQVRRARIGGSEPIPLLEDVLGTWPDVRLNIDVKVGGAVEPLAETVRRCRAYDRVCVASFSDARRRAVLRRLPRGVAASPGRTGVARFWGAVRAGAPDAVLRRATRDIACVQVPIGFGRVQVVDERFVSAAHRVGVQVHVWTVNDPAEMRRLLRLGVDALVTDRSDLALPVVAEATGRV